MLSACAAFGATPTLLHCGQPLSQDLTHLLNWSQAILLKQSAPGHAASQLNSKLMPANELRIHNYCENNTWNSFSSWGLHEDDFILILNVSFQCCFYAWLVCKLCTGQLCNTRSHLRHVHSSKSNIFSWSCCLDEVENTSVWNSFDRQLTNHFFILFEHPSWSVRFPVSHDTAQPRLHFFLSSLRNAGIGHAHLVRPCSWARVCITCVLFA